MQEAVAAREQTNGYRLDKSHVFAVNMFDDFEKYSKVPDVYAVPDVKPYQPTVSDWCRPGTRRGRGPD